MQQKELKQLSEKGQILSVRAIEGGDYISGISWVVVVNTNSNEFITIRTARGGKRKFKTLDAVKKMLAEINIVSFSVTNIEDL